MTARNDLAGQIDYVLRPTSQSFTLSPSSLLGETQSCFLGQVLRAAHRGGESCLPGRKGLHLDAREDIHREAGIWVGMGPVMMDVGEAGLQ